jgi:hypothetical protein
MASSKHDLLITDLSKHYRRKLERLTDDITDTATRGDVSAEETAALIIRNLLCISAVIVIQTGGGKADFLKACDTMFDVMMKVK